jgi:hypothetical protein
MAKHLWKDNADCLDLEQNKFFDIYEEQVETRASVDSLCQGCSVAKECFAVGVSGKEWGVWGGVYLEGGEISREFNNHKSKKDWATTWLTLTTS